MARYSIYIFECVEVANDYKSRVVPGSRDLLLSIFLKAFMYPYPAPNRTIAATSATNEVGREIMIT